MLRFVIFITISMGLNQSLMAKGSTATITRMYGKVQLLVNPAKNKTGAAPHALYKGKYYNVRKAKKGMIFSVGSVIKTGKSSKAKIIYPNGDQISIGSETFLKISYKKSVSRKILDLFSGSVRAIVEKKGNRNRLEVRTKSMTMGVRGTDFYVDAHNEEGETTVTLIRGVVEVTPSETKKTFKLETGYTMEIDSSKDKPVVVTRTNKSDLKLVEDSTSIKKKEGEIDDPSITDLEKMAVKVTKNDIKLYDPVLYEKVKTMKADDAAELSSVVINEASKEAPVKGSKPDLDEPKSKESIYNK